MPGSRITSRQTHRVFLVWPKSESDSWPEASCCTAGGGTRAGHQPSPLRPAKPTASIFLSPHAGGKEGGWPYKVRPGSAPGSYAKLCQSRAWPEGAWTSQPPSPACGDGSISRSDLG